MLPGPEVTRAWSQESCECQSDGGGGWDASCVSVGLHLKGRLEAEPFTVSRSWLALEGAVPPASASPQIAKHQNAKKVKSIANAGNII